MKKMLATTEYYFNAGSNNIDFSMYPDFDPKRLLAVINVTTGQTLIYATGGGPSSPVGGTFSGSFGSYSLALTFNTSSAGMSDADILQIIYDESVGVEEAKASIDIVSGKAGLDVNLLNSSFGGTVGDVMPAPFQDNALSIGVLNGGVLESPAMNVNNELIVDATQSGPVPVLITNTVPLSGNVTVDNFPATQPVSAVSLPLPSGASTSALQGTGNTSLNSIDTKLNSQATAAKQDAGNASLVSLDQLMLAMLNTLEQIANPMSMETASGRLRVVLDPLGGAQTLGTVTAVGTVTTVSTVTTVTTVSSLTNMAQIGGVQANSMIYDTMANCWTNTVRGRIS